MTWTFNPPANGMRITIIDAHAAGEPLRVITEGPSALRGTTLLEKRRTFQDHLDHIRRALMWEPRGRAEMLDNASLTGKNEFWFDPDNPLGEGFLLR